MRCSPRSPCTRCARDPILDLRLLTGVSAAVLTQLGTDTSEVLVSGALMLSGVGMGTVMVPAMAAAIRDLPPSAIPRGSAANRIITQLGSSFGAAILIIVLQNRIDRLVDTRTMTPGGLAGAYGRTFWWVLGFAAVSVVLALLMSARPPQQPDAPAGVPVAETR